MKSTLLRTILLLIAVCTARSMPQGTTSHTAREWYAAPLGSRVGSGSMGSPWDLQTALNGGPSGTSVLPGDTVWLRGGAYAGSFRCGVRGTATAPVVVRAYPGERVILDNGKARGDALWVPLDRGYVWIWGLEITDSDPTRVTSVGGNNPPIHRGNNSTLDIYGPGVKVINCVIHDGSNGMGVWSNEDEWALARNAEVYGCLVFNNGWHAPTRGSGHGIYAQNHHRASEPSEVRIRDAIIWNNFGYGLHVYSEDETDLLNRISVEGVIAFNNGSPTAAFRRTPIRYPNIATVSTIRAQEIAIRDCCLYHPTLSNREDETINLLAGFDSILSRGLTLERNRIAGGGRQIWLKGWRDVVGSTNVVVARGAGADLVWLDTHDRRLPVGYAWNDNAYLDDTPPTNGERFTFRCDGVFDPAGTGDSRRNLRYSTWRSGTGFDSASTYRPAPGAGLTNSIVVRPNAYERGRAHIAVFNWERRTGIAVDLATTGLTDGQPFEIRNVQNLFGEPSFKGVFDSRNPVIVLPLTDTAVTPLTGFERYSIPSTLPEFGAFLLLPT